MREFALEAKRHGLLFVPMRDRTNPGSIEIAIWADDAAKVERIIDRMQLDVVETGEAEIMSDVTPEQNVRGQEQAGPDSAGDPSRRQPPSRLNWTMPTMTWVLPNRPRRPRSRRTRLLPARPGGPALRPRRPPPAEAARPVFRPRRAPTGFGPGVSAPACGMSCGKSRPCCAQTCPLRRSPKRRSASNGRIWCGDGFVEVSLDPGP